MKNYVLFILIALTIFTSCKLDYKLTSKAFSNEDVMGEWSIITAKKDHKSTKMLDRSVLTIKEQDLKANFLGGSELPYVLEGDLLKIKSKKEYQFHIIKLKNDTLSLEGKIGRSPLEMIFVKKQG